MTCGASWAPPAGAGGRASLLPAHRGLPARRLRAPPRRRPDAGENPRSPRRLSPRFIAAAEQAGIPRIGDYNGPEQEGVSVVQLTQRNGRRWSAADAFLRPVMSRPNLEVLTGAHVLRVELEGDRATGVRYRDRRGRERSLRAQREVILCGGAINSPQLLMLSGIGPAEHLRDMGVAVSVDLPGVGQNLQDHPFVVQVWHSNASDSLLGAERPRALAEWLLRRSGPLSSSVAEAFAFVRSRPELPAPDLQFHFAPAYFVNHGFDEYDGHAFTLGPVLLTPKSRGWLKLRSADPHGQAALYHQFADRARGRRRAGRRRAAGARDRRPGAAGVGPRRRAVPRASRSQTDAELEADLRRRVGAHLPPGRHLSHGHRRAGGRRSRSCASAACEGCAWSTPRSCRLIPGGNTNAPTIDDRRASRRRDSGPGRERGGAGGLSAPCGGAPHVGLGRPGPAWRGLSRWSDALAAGTPARRPSRLLHNAGVSARMVSALMFFPRGGSAYVARALARGLVGAGMGCDTGRRLARRRAACRRDTLLLGPGRAAGGLRSGTGQRHAPELSGTRGDGADAPLLRGPARRCRSRVRRAGRPGVRVAGGGLGARAAARRRAPRPTCFTCTT